MTEYVGYFDGSGAEDRPAVVVAGALASMREWERFDAAFAALLNIHDVVDSRERRHLHMTEFVRSRRSPGMRHRFYEQVLDVAEQFLGGIVVHGVLNADLAAINEQVRQRADPPPWAAAVPFARCSLRVCIEALDWLVERNVLDGKLARLLFEQGDLGDGGAKALTTLYGAQFVGEPPSLEFVPKGPAGLQLADMLAWSTNRLISSNDEERYPRAPDWPEVVLAWRVHRSPLKVAMTREVQREGVRVARG